jgi:hypothetical protein
MAVCVRKASLNVWPVWDLERPYKVYMLLMAVLWFADGCTLLLLINALNVIAAWRLPQLYCYCKFKLLDVCT